MLIDVHAHFYTERSGRSDWMEVNEARLIAGRRIGITAHVASILGTWGSHSPTYFPSREDIEHANDRMVSLTENHDGVLAYCAVNPNYTDHALQQIEQRLEQGMIGVKLAASRRADDALLDPIAELAGLRDVPILHHVWHHRRRDWPGQEASDAEELGLLAARHPKTRFIMAHLGGGGDWAHSLRVAHCLPNMWIDLSGSGVDIDMMHAALSAVGPSHLLWGTDITMDTGWGKLRYLEACGLSSEDVERVRFRNARYVFREGAFGAGH